MDRPPCFFLTRDNHSFNTVCLFWILSDSNVSLEEQIWLTECIYLADYFKLRKKRKNRM